MHITGKFNSEIKGKSMKNKFRSFLVIAGFIGSMASAVAEELKIATVDMQKLFNEYHMTKTAQEQLKVDQAAIQQDNAKRLEHIRTIQEAFEKLDKQRKDATISAEKRLEIERDMKMKASEGNAADNERRQWLGRKNKAIQENIGEKMGTILGKIKEQVTTYAREQDFDMVMDKSAVGITRVEVFVYSKDKFDITEALLKTLNKDAPATAPAATPAPAPATDEQ